MKVLIILGVCVLIYCFTGATEYSGFTITLRSWCGDSQWDCTCEPKATSTEASDETCHNGTLQRMNYYKCNTVIAYSYRLHAKKIIYKDISIVCLLLVTGILLIWKILRQQHRTKVVNTAVEKISRSNVQLLSKIKYLRAILDVLEVGVIATDIGMTITYMNSAAGRMCEWCPKLAIGRPINEVVRYTSENPELRTSYIIQNVEVTHLTSLATSLVQKSQNGEYIDVHISPLLVNGKSAGTVTLLLDVTASHDVIRKLSHSASHDPLTGLPNRASFEAVLQRAVITSKVKSMRHALVFVDLDGFKTINDTAGHAAGDELLKQIARLMQSQLRHTDFVARLGGDEFGIILFNCGLLQAKALVGRLVIAINKYPFSCKGKVQHIGASVGITSVDCNTSDIGKLLAEADAACYDAKRRGKGQVCLFEHSKTPIF